MESTTSHRPKREHQKFSLGQCVKANDKAPGDYKDREGIITDIRFRGRTTQYGVRFDHEEGKADEGYFDSWMLDPKRESKVKLEEEKHRIEEEISELESQRFKADLASDKDDRLSWADGDEKHLDEEIRNKRARLEAINEALKR